jgi:citrate synthase
VAVRGLQDVIAGETRVGEVDGVNGKLYYAGFDIDELAGRTCFEEIVFLLWRDRLPTRAELEELRASLQAEMSLPAPLVDFLRAAPPGSHPMALLRTGVSMLSLYDPDGRAHDLAANQRKALRLVAKLPTLVAAMHRVRQGQPLVPPAPGSCLAANFLRQFLGREIDPEESDAIELMFILHAEHGFNASTFAARVAASTLADMYAAITAAVCTLEGPLHGGANQRVMEMLTDIGHPEDVDDYLEGMLSRREKVMGFGHREYKVEDPRAKHLRKRAGKVCYRDRECLYFRMSEVVEKKVMEAKGISPNVDFYSATVQQSLGIPVEYFTALFAASRIAGWSAHVLEQLAENRLIRPKSQFVGRYPRAFVPLAERTQ